jgi:hypothetical protein
MEQEGTEYRFAEPGMRNAAAPLSPTTLVIFSSACRAATGAVILLTRLGIVRLIGINIYNLHLHLQFTFTFTFTRNERTSEGTE